MSLVGWDMDRIGDPIKGLRGAVIDFVAAYAKRTTVEAGKVDALTRIAAALERENE